MTFRLRLVILWPDLCPFLMVHFSQHNPCRQTAEVCTVTHFSDYRVNQARREKRIGLGLLAVEEKIAQSDLRFRFKLQPRRPAAAFCLF
jgi:hypothetical protein